MHILHIVTFMDSLSGFELSSDEDEPSLRPENPDDISNAASNDWAAASDVAATACTSGSCSFRLWFFYAHPLNPVLDPPIELIGITILFIEWYNLYRRRFPPKDQVDLQDLTSVGETCVHILHILHILYVLLTCMHIEGTWNSVG